MLVQSNNRVKIPCSGKHAWHTTIKNKISLNDIATYLNTSNNRITQETQINKHTMYITDLNKLKGLHILNKAINPATIIPIDAIVTSSAVVIGINIW